MHAAYALHLEQKREDCSRPVGSPCPSSGPAALPQMSALWDEPEQGLPTYRGGSGGSFGSTATGLDDPFGALALGGDEYVDIDNVPVYRSMSSVFANAQFVDAPEVYDEAPVYRSLGSAFEASEPASAFVDPFNAVAPESSNPAQEPLDSQWLQVMPPLVRRQTGGILG